MKISKKSVFSFALCLVAIPAVARDVTGKIADLTTYGDGHSMIRIEGGPINGCSSQYWYSLGVKGQDIKAEPMLSVALAAYLSGRTVMVSSADAVCQGGQEKINFIKITPQ